MDLETSNSSQFLKDFLFLFDTLLLLFFFFFSLNWFWKHRVGLDIPTIEVRFEHLSIEAEAYVGGRALPTIFNFSANMLEVQKLL